MYLLATYCPWSTKLAELPAFATTSWQYAVNLLGVYAQGNVSQTLFGVGLEMMTLAPLAISCFAASVRYVTSELKC